MTEINEIRIGDDLISLKDNLVRSNILPSVAKDIARNIKVQGNVVVEGSVFGNNIEIVGGGVEFKGAVFANNDLYIASDVDDSIVFQKAVASASSISAFSTSQKILFYSDLNAKEIRLKNCYVGGSIYGNNVTLENCIVLGGIFGVKQISITNCIYGTFNAPSVEVAGTNYMLYPTCFSVEPLNVLPGTEIYNISLAHLGALFKGDPEDKNTGKIKVDIDNDKQHTVLINDDDSTSIVNSYSVSSRVLVADLIDMEKLENHFLIGAGALGTQMLKTYNLTKEDGSKSEELTVDNIATFFFDILEGRIQIQDLSGEISFEELKKSFE